MIRIDLHVHSALSACAENIMGPRQILETAQSKGLKMLAITDHNASGNVGSVIKLAGDYGIRIIPGIEITTREEVHLLALFDTVSAVSDLQVLIDKLLPEMDNMAEFYGYQLLYDDQGEIVDVDEQMRQVGISMGLDDLAVEVHDRGGVVVPAHVFRKKFSLTSQLGFIPAGACYDAVEVNSVRWWKEHAEQVPVLEGYPVITGSDAHFLDDIGKRALNIPVTLKTINEVVGYLQL